MGNLRIEGLYWFIWAIIFYGFISSTLSKIKLDNLFTFIVIGFIIMFFSNKNPIFDLIESMYPFFVIGFQLAKLKLEKYYYWVQKSLPFLFVINILCILFWDKRTYIYITPSQWVTLDITIFRLFTGVVSSLVFLILTYYLYNIIKQFQILNLFISFGRTSLAIYLIQTILYYNIDLYTNFDLCKKWSSLIFIIPSFLLTYLFYLFYQLTYHNKFANFLLYGNLKK